MSWDDFFSRVKKDKYHGFKDRCALLTLVHQAFDTHPAFLSMNKGIQNTIAGLPNKHDMRWGWFGNMQGAGIYHKIINNNPGNLSDALDSIPLKGPISKDQYDLYISKFKNDFPVRNSVGIASRLLAMKRPDYFVCVDAPNKSGLCKDFGIPQSKLDYDTYWRDIIERIMDSVWWNSPRPNNLEEAAVWDGRSALLDAIFYSP